jgi:hypothetical protein
MRRHRTIFSTLLLVAFAAVPSSALAGSLLSGYGGPGGGAQAILGSALVNGPGGDAGGAGGGGSAGGAASGTPSGAQAGGALGAAGATTGTPSGAQAGRAGTVGSTHTSGVHPGGTTRSGANAGTSGGAASTYTSPGSTRITAETAAADDMGVLSFTGSDLLLMALVLGVLAVTAGLTRRLTGTQHYR